MKLNKENFAKAFNMIYRTYMLRYGYTSYYYSFFKRKLKDACKDKSFPGKERKWAKKHGFFPWRIQQYSLTEENYRKIISDEDYYYLYPLNSGYSKWIDDKLTMKYVLAPFSAFMPQYYFHLTDNHQVMRLMDCPAQYDNSSDGIIELLKDKRVVAAKAVASSQGIGFYKIKFENEIISVNNNEMTSEAFKRFLDDLGEFVVTDYVEMHQDLKKINPDAVNTIRVMVINEHGDDPIIPFVYMRIGTKRSGSVDNVAQGGMVCKVDAETGRFYDAESLSNHVYHKELVHPDTKEPLEGILPNWDLVKNTIIQIAKYMPQLRWLGYDVAITADGFKILEVNSHQGLHKANEYPEEVNRFLFAALEKKKKKYGRN